MTQQELDALRALADAATPGPWEEVVTEGEWWLTGPDIFQDAVMRIDDAELSQADAAFIAAARVAVPALIAEVERLQAALLQMELERQAWAVIQTQPEPLDDAGLIAWLREERDAKE